MQAINPRADQVPESLGKIGAAPAEESLSFRDVLDAINPLNHIPIVSDIFASATGHKPSSLSKLAGGAIIGGPIGFVASLAGVIFEDATGTSPVGAVVAALTGEAVGTQVADNAVAAEEPAAIAQAAPTDAIEVVENAPMKLAALAPNAGKAPALTYETNQAVLSLYGASEQSVHDSYRKAQLRPYLTDVTVSKVL